MIDLTVYNRDGKEVDRLQVDEAALGGSVQILINNAQDSLGYIIDPIQYADHRYSYEKLLCIGPELGPAVVEAHCAMAAIVQLQR